MKKLAALVLVGLVAGGLMKAEAQTVPALDAINTDAELTSAISGTGYAIVWMPITIAISINWGRWW